MRVQDLLVWIFLLLIESRATQTLKYEKEGEFIIGAILPISRHAGNGQCRAHPKGVALTEAIVEALTRIESDNEFTTLLSTTKIGYNIQDSCGQNIKEREIVYDFNKETLNHARNKSYKVAPSVVISSFDKDSVNIVKLLNVENIPQISFSKNNVKLLQDSSINDNSVKQLISAFPENTQKINAIVDIIQEFAFEYVYGIFSDDYQSLKAKTVFEMELAKKAKCQASFVTNNSDIDTVIKKIKMNRYVKVAIVHTTKSLELEIYKRFSENGLNDLIIISTRDWSKNENSVKKYKSLTDGMIYLENKKDIRHFEALLKGIHRPYTKKDWVKRLYYERGGNDDCLNASIRNTKTEPCFKAEEDVKVEMVKAAGKAVYALDAVYTVAYALLKGKNILESVKGLTFSIPLLPMNEIVYTDYLTVAANNFQIQQFRYNQISSMLIGSWENRKNERRLGLRMGNVQWKNGSKETLESSYSLRCKPGTYRKFLSAESNCCWECLRCPNGTFSNVTNADKCRTCGTGCVPTPDQTSFLYFKVERFEWFGSLGSFIIFLIVVLCVLVFLAVGILSQNSDNEFVELSGYYMLCYFLIGCLCLAFAPVPLLAKPTIGGCGLYIFLFNFGLTIIFSVLISRSSYINSFYVDYTGDVVKKGLGKYPRAIVLIILASIQLLILCVGFAADRPKTLYSDTLYWDVKYWECSSWASYVFWVAFGYNITLSILGNFFSCSSTALKELGCELKYILISYLVFYINGIIEIIIFYRVVEKSLAAGQAIMCIVIALCFYFLYIGPKIYIVLKQRSTGKSYRKQNGLDEEKSALTTAVSSADGYRRGVVQMKIKEQEGNGNSLLSETNT